jgi:hypothetical protein
MTVFVLMKKHSESSLESSVLNRGSVVFFGNVETLLACYKSVFFQTD